MKIRKGFVSNSSSTSYVIALTRDYEASEEKVLEFMKEYEECYDEELGSIEKARELIAWIIGKLCSSEQVWTEEYEGVCCFIQAFSDDICLTYIDSGPDDSSISNIFADKCKDETIEKMKKFIKLCRCKDKESKDEN